MLKLINFILIQGNHKGLPLYLIGLFLMGSVGCTVAPTPPQVINTQVPSQFPPTTSKGQSQSKRQPQGIAPTRAPRERISPRTNPTVRYAPKNRPSPIDSRNYMARGVATWYGIKAHGTKTASGQIYDLYGMTAAHASLPLNTRVRVRNLKTGRSMTVTINDRLYSHSAIIKLSYWAARHLGLTKRPSQKVEVRVVR